MVGYIRRAIRSQVALITASDLARHMAAVRRRRGYIQPLKLLAANSRLRQSARRRCSIANALRAFCSSRRRRAQRYLAARRSAVERFYLPQVF